nr:MAG TPA: hypothetical protein [Caudoviricetes sp.]
MRGWSYYLPTIRGRTYGNLFQNGTSYKELVYS